jgi:hypothetical protein
MTDWYEDFDITPDEFNFHELADIRQDTEYHLSLAVEEVFLETNQQKRPLPNPPKINESIKTNGNEGRNTIIHNIHDFVQHRFSI